MINKNKTGTSLSQLRKALLLDLISPPHLLFSYSLAAVFSSPLPSILYSVHLDLVWVLV